MTQQTALVTGASSGIGQACALRLARLGWRVFAAVRNPAAGEALKQKHSNITSLILDVTDEAQIRTAVEQVGKAVGAAGLQGLVNNAGIAVAAPLEFIPIDELRRQLEVNVVAQMAVTQAFLPLLRQGHGRIVNMSSVGGKSVVPMLGPYSASKYALEALSDALRMELMPSGIHVAIIEPASIKTPIWDKSLAAADELERKMSPKAQEVYGVPMANMRKLAVASNRTGVPASAVAKAVTHALTANQPKVRYLVGNARGRVQTLANLLPARWRDRLLVGMLWREPKNRLKMKPMGALHSSCRIQS